MPASRASDDDLTRLRQQLAPRFTDRWLESGHPGFDAAIHSWNAAVAHRPLALVRCRDAEDVQAALLAARACQVPLSVLAGGHDWAGRGVRPGGLVLDLGPMKSVAVDEATRIATVGGGTLAGDLLAQGLPHGLVAVTGTSRTVGMAGLTLGGGYGLLNGRFGLAADNLLRAEVILADGRKVVASPEDDPELFWALRGGGGNFGVVTSLAIQLHRVPQVLSGAIMFPLFEAERVLRGFRELFLTMPDELTVMLGLMNPGGQPMLFMGPCWSGDLAEGERQIQRLRTLGTPMVTQVAPASYLDALGMFETELVPGNHYAIRSRRVATLSDEVISVLIDAAQRIASPASGLVLRAFQGAGTRVAPDATAVGLRAPHVVLDLVASWPSTDTPDSHQRWGQETWERLAPHALPGGYPNLLGPEQGDQVQLSYGTQYGRLIAAKRRYDPDHVFSAVPTLAT